MITRLEMSVQCNPVGMPRPNSRAVRTRSGKYIATTYYPTGPGRTKQSRAVFEAHERARAFKTAIKAELARHVGGTGVIAEPWEGPVRVDIEAFFERPQRLLKARSPEGIIPHTAKPDRDNLDKVVLDALKDAGLMRDDSQAFTGLIQKWYVAKGCAPGVRIVAELVGGGAGGGALFEEKPG